MKIDFLYKERIYEVSEMPYARPDLEEAKRTISGLTDA
jgi:hypothetical protein